LHLETFLLQKSQNLDWKVKNFKMAEKSLCVCFLPFDKKTAEIPLNLLLFLFLVLCIWGHNNS